MRLYAFLGCVSLLSIKVSDISGDHFKDQGFFPEEVMLRQAGDAQISGGTSKAEWQKYGTREVNAGRGETRTVPGVMVSPYGDDPRDQKMIIKGFNYLLPRRVSKYIARRCLCGMDLNSEGINARLAVMYRACPIASGACTNFFRRKLFLFCYLG